LDFSKELSTLSTGFSTGQKARNGGKNAIFCRGLEKPQSVFGYVLET